MLREAARGDAAQIADLVNLAYRPGVDAGGWTHESGLIAGQRICVDQVLALFDSPGTVVVDDDHGVLRGCVHVEPCVWPHAGPDPACCRIGMLAVMPSQQGQGGGHTLLAAAEALAAARYGAQGIEMWVLSSRPELLAYYERRGYRLTGVQRPYPVALGVGQPRVDGLCLLGLSKALAPS